MKICRFTSEVSDTPKFGVIEGDYVQPLSGLPYTGLVKEGQPLPLGKVSLCAPVNPSKIVCVGRNYRDHAAELGNPMPSEPLLFLKATSALIGPGDKIVLPEISSQVEHEGELGVVIGRTARRLADDCNPLAYVFGYTCLNDVTARDIQRRDIQFTRGKSFDTFCPVGPYIETSLRPDELELTTRLNGKTTQRGKTSDMAFDVPYLLRYISRCMTLYPGDLLATGTPAGVSRMIPGDVVEVEVSSLGVLTNHVVAL
jgi:2-keto-4-pentenoate hydratase/2-oxohepta-3-ene-1,7-dioic acid hydratase in catechol pathway